jgi:hypothetical protein
MRKKHEVNGIPIRSELKDHYEKILAVERHFDWLILSSAGMEFGSNETSTRQMYHMKQTELDFIVANILRNSRFKWKTVMDHEEGDVYHFGKIYRFDKCAVK